MGRGEKTILIFQIDYDAPRNGLLINASTDIPDSVIMPEVIIPEGARMVSVTVEGGQTGSGKIFITAPGFKETIIPITVIDSYESHQSGKNIGINYIPHEIL